MGKIDKPWLKGNQRDKIDKVENGSMAQNLEEVIKLGKEMRQAKTGTELEEEDQKTPDPLQ